MYLVAIIGSWTRSPVDAVMAGCRNTVLVYGFAALEAGYSAWTRYRPRAHITCDDISGLADDAMSDEIRGEADKLTAEYKNAETQHRAALVAEGDEQRAAEGEFGNADGEPGEVRALLGRVGIHDYLNPAAGGVG